MLHKLNNKTAGFTLVEIMIVVAIIALLASIAVPNFLRSRKRSQATQVLQDLRILDSAIDLYAIENSKTGGFNPVFADLKNYIKRPARVSTQAEVPERTSLAMPSAPTRWTPRRRSLGHRIQRCLMWPPRLSGHLTSKTSFHRSDPIFITRPSHRFGRVNAVSGWLVQSQGMQTMVI